jgi:hypothetical protein
VARFKRGYKNVISQGMKLNQEVRVSVDSTTSAPQLLVLGPWRVL